MLFTYPTNCHTLRFNANRPHYGLPTKKGSKTSNGANHRETATEIENFHVLLHVLHERRCERVNELLEGDVLVGDVLQAETLIDVIDERLLKSVEALAIGLRGELGIDGDLEDVAGEIDLLGCLSVFVGIHVMCTFWC